MASNAHAISRNIMKFMSFLLIAVDMSEINFLIAYMVLDFFSVGKLVVRDNFMMVEIPFESAINEFFKNFTNYGCYRDGSVVCK